MVVDQRDVRGDADVVLAASTDAERWSWASATFAVTRAWSWPRALTPIDGRGTLVQS